VIWLAPLAIDVLDGVAAIATGGDHTCALMESGGIRCWGSSVFGQIGVSPPDSTRPKLVEGLCW